MQKLILIGSSTGGPGHLQRIVSSLPKDFNATIVIAQHMGSQYLKSFASGLNDHSQLDVNLLNETTYLQNSTIYVCEQTCQFELSNKKIKLSPVHNENQPSYNPNISRLFSSATELCVEHQLMAIILTGIGDDGASGMLDLSRCNVQLIGESQESAIVYGMPMRSKELIHDLSMLSINEIIDSIKKFGL